ncbi:MAG: HYExAFE family protein [Anaerohalosphaeraceae bacterium]
MESPNVYEAAFEAWLAERKISYRSIPQGRRREPERPKKRFDYLLCPESSVPILAEVKGRTFEGQSLVGRRGLDGWTTRLDLQGLQQWEDMFVRYYPGCRAVFVFVFCLKQPDVDADGLEVFVHNGRRFVFLAVEAGVYRACAIQRSPKWRTVTLKAEDFRRCTVPLEVYLETIWNESGD